MWKKLKESTSGLNLTFFTDIFKRRHYSKFDSEEDLCNDPESETSGVQWSRSSGGEPDGDGSGSYTTATLHHCDTKVDNHGQNGYQQDNLYTRHDDNQNVRFVDLQSDKYDSNLHNHQHHTADTDVAGHDYYGGSRGRNQSGSSSHNYNIGSEVQGIVHGLNQRRYQKLDDSDISDAEFDVDVQQEIDNDNNVFHSMRDIDTNRNKNYSSKKKRRKKLAKKTRKALRISWKWLKSGFIGYAHGFVAPSTNVFVYVHTRK